MSTGYTPSELDDIQAKWNLRFPPDLVALLREHRRVIEQGERSRSLDWIRSTDDQIADSLNWPFEGFLFDVQNGLWWPEWGEMPSEPSLREERLKAIFAKAPKLIPVYGHRYIPEDPHEAGNPIFSVWQMDVIYYGADLADYIKRETNVLKAHEPLSLPMKEIAFWSRAVEFNDERFSTNGGFAFFNRNRILPE